MPPVLCGFAGSVIGTSGASRIDLSCLEIGRSAGGSRRHMLEAGIEYTEY